MQPNGAKSNCAEHDATAQQLPRGVEFALEALLHSLPLPLVDREARALRMVREALEGFTVFIGQPFR
jgi:hypothetical protein